MEILHVENLSFTYPNSSQKALNGINLSVDSGEFVVICGESGCGKTTLLKMMKRELSPAGKRTGEILYDAVPLDELDGRTAAGDIGYVLQNPDSQIVTDRVWRELSFGLENLGLPTELIRRRVGEMASYFGIGEWYHKKTEELSGGQKQLVNLASVMAMSPKILILDEPTSQLDPIAASDFIATLKKLNSELSLTIILVEHRLEEVLPIADRVIVMENAEILCSGSPREVCRLLRGHRLMAGVPGAVRIHSGLNSDVDCPLTVREGREFLSAHYLNKVDSIAPTQRCHSPVKAVECKNVWFRYGRELTDVLCGAELTVFEGESLCIVGGNGAGKTTLLRAVAGLEKPYRGSIKIFDKKIRDYSGGSLYRRMTALLPQNPTDVFLKNTVAQELSDTCALMGIDGERREESLAYVTQLLGLDGLTERHPYDLSGGEQQKCALAKLLLLEPRILLLDEPTKGIDAYSKQTLSGILKQLRADGVTVITVTHDIEFAAENADRCALFFDGELVSCEEPSVFFSDNNFYTTAASRISRHMFSRAVTCADVIGLCKKDENQRRERSSDA